MIGKRKTKGVKREEIRERHFSKEMSRKPDTKKYRRVLPTYLHEQKQFVRVKFDAKVLDEVRMREAFDNFDFLRD